jgi:hypothetical protein
MVSIEVCEGIMLLRLSDCGHLDDFNVICDFYYMTFHNIVKFMIATTDTL